MSIEQLLLLVIFLIVPLIQSLLARRSKRGSGEVDPDAESDLEDRVVRSEERAPPPYAPPRPASAPRLPKPETPSVIVGPRPAQADVPAPVRVAAAPARPVPALGSRQRAQSRHLQRWVPRDAGGWRRAVLLAEVLGPPRSLDRSDPLRR